MRRVLAALMLCLAAAGTPAADQARHGFAPPAGIGGPIDLVDQRGTPFSLARVAGRPTLLFFGFLHCGSTCPVALVTAQHLLREFAPGEAPAIVFVTLDASDGPAELGAFLDKIDPRLIGLTGDPAHIERVAQRYGVGVRRQPEGIEHSSMWYLLDGAGHLKRVYPYSTPAAQLVTDLRALQAR